MSKQEISNEFIKIENLNLIDKDFVILNNININFKKNAINIIVGENGAGKTSLLECLVGIRKDYSGFISFNDNISFFEAHPYLEPGLRVSDFIEYSLMATNNDIKDYKAETNRVLKDFGIMHIANSKLGQLSSGQIRLVYILSKYYDESEIMVFDEPTANLDPTMRTYIFELISSFKDRGKTIIICTHLINEIKNMGEYCTLISSGEIKYNGKFDIKVIDSFFLNRKAPSDLERK